MARTNTVPWAAILRGPAIADRKAGAPCVQCRRGGCGGGQGILEASGGAECVTVSAAVEAEIAMLADAGERTAFLASPGLEESGLDRVIRAGYRLLGLITFLTTGPKEARAWTVAAGATAPEAAGRVHTDFERGANARRRPRLCGAGRRRDVLPLQTLAIDLAIRARPRGMLPAHGCGAYPFREIVLAAEDEFQSLLEDDIQTLA